MILPLPPYRLILKVVLSGNTATSTSHPWGWRGCARRWRRPPRHRWTFMNTPVLKSGSLFSLFPPLSRATMRATQRRPTSHMTAITVSRRRKWIRRLFGLYLLLTQRTHVHARAHTHTARSAQKRKNLLFSPCARKLMLLHGLDDSVLI